MERYQEEFIDFMVESDVLKFGDFTLKSGNIEFFASVVTCHILSLVDVHGACRTEGVGIPGYEHVVKFLTVQVVLACAVDVLGRDNVESIAHSLYIEQ